MAGVWAWVFLFLLLIIFSITGRGFFSMANYQNIAIAATLPLIIGLGQTFVIISGGIDLSVGYVMGFTSVVAAVIMRHLYAFGRTPLDPDWSWPVQLWHDIGTSQPLTIAIGIAAGLLAGLIPGFINGIIIAKLRVPPFIVTLGMLGICRGIGFLIADGRPVPGQPPALGTHIGNSYIVHLFPSGLKSFFAIPPGLPPTELRQKLSLVPILVIVAIVLVLLCNFIMSRTRFGQYTYAVGGSRDAAIRAGIPVARHTILIYMFSALLAAVAGVLYTARFIQGAADAGDRLLLDSIAAVVIGGTSLFGGEGTIPGTVIGALIIATLQTGLVILAWDPFWQYVAVGLVIITAVLVDQTRKRYVPGS